MIPKITINFESFLTLNRVLTLRHTQKISNTELHKQINTDIIQHMLLVAISSMGRHLSTLPFISGRTPKIKDQVLDLSIFYDLFLYC